MEPRPAEVPERLALCAAFYSFPSNCNWRTGSSSCESQSGRVYDAPAPVLQPSAFDAWAEVL